MRAMVLSLAMERKRQQGQTRNGTPELALAADGQIVGASGVITKSGKRVTVELIGYGKDAAPVAVPRPSASTKYPTRVDCFTLPARFRVTGFAVAVEIEIGATTNGPQPRLGCTRVELLPGDGGALVEKVERLPLDTLRDLALAALLRAGVWYPPKYNGPLLDQFMREIPGTNLRCTSRPQLKVFDTPVLLNRAHTRLPKMAGKQARPRRGRRTERVYEIVRDAYYSAPERKRLAAVAAALLEHGSDVSTAQRNVRSLVDDMKKMIADDDLAPYKPTKPTTRKATK